LIDEVAFIQALTLIAIMHESPSLSSPSDSLDDDEANARIDDEDESLGDNNRMMQN
jgi:hypothetical protein